MDDAEECVTRHQLSRHVVILLGGLERVREIAAHLENPQTLNGTDSAPTCAAVARVSSPAVGRLVTRKRGWGHPRYNVELTL